jgi:hypothetical protein
MPKRAGNAKCRNCQASGAKATRQNKRFEDGRHSSSIVGVKIHAGCANERPPDCQIERQCLDVGQGMAAAYYQGVIAANVHHGWPVMVQQDT